MNINIIVMMVILPMVIVYIAVRLALACRYHPYTRAVIIPDDTSKAVEAAPTSDLNTRSKLFITVAIGVGIAVVLSLVLLVLTNLDVVGSILGPMPSLLEGLNMNLVIVGYVIILLVFGVPTVAVSLTWMTPLRGILVAVICIGIFLAWALVDSWITFDLMTGLVCIVMAPMLQRRISFMRLSTILLVLAVLYDVWQVYGTGSIAKLASNLQPVFGTTEWHVNYPAELLIPDSLTLSPHGYGGIGVGDIIVFSVLAIAVAR